jgi:hypothetical protein
MESNCKGGICWPRPHGADDARPSEVEVTFRISESEFFLASFRSGVRRKPSLQALVLM